jgi:hypothetical protein
MLKVKYHIYRSEQEDFRTKTHCGGYTNQGLAIQRAEQEKVKFPKQHVKVEMTWRKL